MTQELNSKDYKELISKVKRLTVKEKYHILSIFKKYNVEFTKNSNGYFFNLDKINPSIIEKVSKCVDLIEEKRELIYSLDKKRDYYLEYYKTLIESKLKDTINKKKKQYIDQLTLIPLESYISKKKPTLRVVVSEDPDVLMKEHLKPKKYDKNSVYFRITQKMYMLSRKNNYKRTEIEDDLGDGSHSGLDVEDNSHGHGHGDNSDYEEGLGDEVEGGIDDEFIDNDIDNDNDFNEDDSNDDDDEDDDDDDDDEGEEYDENSNIDDDEYYKDSEYDEETHDCKTEKTDKSEKTTKTKKSKKKKKTKTHEASSNEIDYYKQLLKQNGFAFKDDKVIIKKEEYIV